MEYARRGYSPVSGPAVGIGCDVVPADLTVRVVFFIVVTVLGISDGRDVGIDPGVIRNMDSNV